MKIEQFAHPACPGGYHAVLIVYANAAELVVVGTVDETERHVASRTRILQHGIWQNLDLVLDAVRQVVLPISRLAYFHRGRFDEGMALVERLNAIVPTFAVRAAKEDLVDQDRPLLFSKFGHRLGRVGIVTAAKMARETIRNPAIILDDLTGVAIAAEEYERRVVKFTRKAKAKPSRPTSIPTPSSMVEDDLRRRIAELEAKVEALVSIMREKELALAA